MAHGDWAPKHGGLMNIGGETSFELVRSSKGRVTLYVEDHGSLVSTAGATGTFEVRHLDHVATTPLSAEGDNRLKADKPQRLAPGDKVTARVTMGNGSIAVGRFVIPGGAADSGNSAGTRAGHLSDTQAAPPPPRSGSP